MLATPGRAAVVVEVAEGGSAAGAASFAGGVHLAVAELGNVRAAVGFAGMCLD